MDAELITKVCSKCKIEKSATDFHKNNSRKDKLCILCKLCSSKRAKKFRADNKEKLAKYRNKYWHENKEKLSKYGKKYRHENKEKLKERKRKYDAKYRTDNKEKLAKYKNKYMHENKEKFALYWKKYRSNNKEKISQQRSAYIDNLNNSYLIQLIINSEKTLKQAQIPQSIINLKREEIKIKRLIKEMTQ